MTRTHLTTPILDDHLLNGSRVVKIFLKDPSGAQLGNSTLALTIVELLLDTSRPGVHSLLRALP